MLRHHSPKCHVKMLMAHEIDECEFLELSWYPCPLWPIPLDQLQLYYKKTIRYGQAGGIDLQFSEHSNVAHSVSEQRESLSYENLAFLVVVGLASDCGLSTQLESWTAHTFASRVSLLPIIHYITVQSLIASSDAPKFHSRCSSLKDQFDSNANVKLVELILTIVCSAFQHGLVYWRSCFMSKYSTCHNLQGKYAGSKLEICRRDLREAWTGRITSALGVKLAGISGGCISFAGAELGNLDLFKRWILSLFKLLSPSGVTMLSPGLPRLDGVPNIPDILPDFCFFDSSSAPMVALRVRTRIPSPLNFGTLIGGWFSSSNSPFSFSYLTGFLRFLASVSASTDLNKLHWSIWISVVPPKWYYINAYNVQAISKQSLLWICTRYIDFCPQEHSTQSFKFCISHASAKQHFALQVSRHNST